MTNWLRHCWRRHARLLLLVASLFFACQPKPTGGTRQVSAPTAPELPASATASRPTPPPPLLPSSDARCDPGDYATLFLPRDQHQTQELLQRLEQGPLAVRFVGCQLEWLPSCQLDGSGIVENDISCCEAKYGCHFGNIECAGADERHWFPSEDEWFANLPELAPKLQTQRFQSLVVQASIEREYRLQALDGAPTACSEATHVVTWARFGQVQVEGQGPRPDGKLTSVEIVAPRTPGLNLVDLGLASLDALGEAGFEPGTQPSCPNEALGTIGPKLQPSWFVGDPAIRRHRRCVRDCVLTRSCPKDCRAGVLGSCGLTGGEPADGVEMPSLIHECLKGWGFSCQMAIHERFIPLGQLENVCTSGGMQTAQVCFEVAQQLEDTDPERALEYAWLACQRGRIKCWSVATALRERKQTDDPRYLQALAMACARYDQDACRRYGRWLLTQPNGRERAKKQFAVICTMMVRWGCADYAKLGGKIPPAYFE